MKDAKASVHHVSCDKETSDHSSANGNGEFKKTGVLFNIETDVTNLAQ
jgi:hypothetical protein